MRTLLSTLLAEFREALTATENSLPRDCQFPELPTKVKVAIGMRRTGKTWFLFQTIRQLLSQKIPLHQILYINFEDDRLFPCTQAQLRGLLEGFYELYPENHNAICHLFLDEIQNVEGWAQTVRRFLDTQKVQLYLSGASSKLLSREIATSLRGRAIATEIWPYSFKEYLTAKSPKLDSALFSKKNQDILSAHLQSYLLEGGFPETLNCTMADRRKILQDYVEVVIMRDIIERHGITNLALLRYCILSLLKNTGTAFSVNKFANDVKSQGFSGAKNTLHDYLAYIEEAYLVFTVPLFSESIRKTQTNPRKIYAIDPGLVKAVTLSLNDNHGHLFENIIFLDLKRRGHKVYYYLTQERYEVDFLTEDPHGQLRLYQVAWNVQDKKTLERETRALETAQKELGIPGELVTPLSFVEKTWQENFKNA